MPCRHIENHQNRPAVGAQRAAKIEKEKAVVLGLPIGVQYAALRVVYINVIGGTCGRLLSAGENNIVIGRRVQSVMALTQPSGSIEAAARWRRRRPLRAGNGGGGDDISIVFIGLP